MVVAIKHHFFTFHGIKVLWHLNKLNNVVAIYQASYFSHLNKLSMVVHNFKKENIVAPIHWKLCMTMHIL